MTKETFQDKIKSIYKSDNITNYVFAWLVLGLGIFLIVKFIVRPPVVQHPSQQYLFWILPCIPLFAALYAFWRIPKDYIAYEIESSKPMEEKLNLIKNYFLDVKVIWHYHEGNYHSYTYRNKFYRKVDVRFYIDDEKVLFNVQGTYTHVKKGFIDFGLTRRASRRLNKYMKDGLVGKSM